MKLIKKNYKMLIGFMLGIIVSAITVYAGTLINSNEVTFTPQNNKWNVTKVDEALNSLYSVAVPEEYSGTTLVTPTYSDITLSTQDKLLKNNITISGIPSTYKNLTNTTTATSSDLATGKTAYNNAGELITGTSVLGGNCVSGTFVTPSDCTTSTGCAIFEGFNATVFLIYYKISGAQHIDYYNVNKDATNIYIFRSNGNYIQKSFSLYYKIENNKLIYHNGTEGLSIDYYICK